jgi:hypothetical protein
MSKKAAGRGTAVLGGALDLRELFPGAWMCEHTEFGDIDAFIEAGDGIPVTRESDRRPAWDDHVETSTSFDDWAAMLDQALDDYRARGTASVTN